VSLKTLLQLLINSEIRQWEASVIGHFVVGGVLFCFVLFAFESESTGEDGFFLLNCHFNLNGNFSSPLAAVVT